MVDIYNLAKAYRLLAKAAEIYAGGERMLRKGSIEIGSVLSNY